MIPNLDQYTFCYGPDAKLLSSQPFPNLNMLNYTAQLLFLIGGDLSEQQQLEYFNGIMACQRKPGTFARAPDNNDNTSVDDYLAITCFKQLAVEVLSNGRHNLGFISVDGKWSFKQWLYRFQGMWVNMQISSNEFVGPIGRLIWSISIILAARKPFEFQDSWIESHLMILVKERRGFKSWICNKAIGYWRRQKGEVTTAEIMYNYLRIPNHPLIEAWKPYN